MSAITKGQPVTLTTDFVEKGFERVREEFLNNFYERREVGASLVVYHKGKIVVNLSGGKVDTKPESNLYTEDTLQVVFSTTKVIEALCIAMLVDSGKLDYDAPIAKYWPEFGTANKQHITVRQLMKHESGLITIPGLTMNHIKDLDGLAKKLASQEPCWIPPDEREQKNPKFEKNPVVEGYHAISRGFYSNELVRRVDGRSLGSFVAEEIAGPLGVEFYVGLPENLESRVAPLVGPSLFTQLKLILSQTTCNCLPSHYGDRIDAYDKKFLGAMFRRKGKKTRQATDFIKGLMPLPAGANRRLYREIEVPSANGVTNAKAIAKIGAVMANKGSFENVKLLSEKTWNIAHESREEPTEDVVVYRKVLFGTGGWGVGTKKFKSALGIEIADDNPFYVSVPGLEDYCGWGGAGGSLCTWNAKRNVAIGYSMNRMGMQTIVDRTMALLAAVQRCVLDVDGV